MNFQELGQALKEERERKGLSIEVVMEATKISRTNIVAMESGDRSTLPHPVYAKGFVKSYARYLGLDAEELSMVVDQEYQDEADGPEEQIYEVSPAAEKAFQDGDSPESKKRSVWPLLLVFVFLIGVAVLLVMNFKGKDNEEQAVSNPTVEQVEEVEKPVMPESEVAPESVVEDSKEEVAAEEVTIAEEPATEEQTIASEETITEAVEAKPATVVKPEPKPELKPEPKPEPKVEKKPEVKQVEVKPKKQKYDHMLVIRATTEKGCWIGVWRGDETKMARDFVLKQGEPLRLMFNSPRRIRIGNAAGVSVMYNGKAYPLNEAKGNIQTLRFGSE